MGETLTVGSLFAGIGGLELGLERAGMVTKWQVEYDDYATKILEKHWPDVKRYGDIHEVRGEELEWVDVICGGFPCQPFSHAGKRRGTADERWLWPEFLRIVREVRPRWVVIENVRGLLSIDSGRVFGGILRDLSDAGYDAEWRIVSAQMLGARHRRERIFIVAHARNGEGRNSKPGSVGGDGGREMATTIGRNTATASSRPSKASETLAHREGEHAPERGECQDIAEGGSGRRDDRGGSDGNPRQIPDGGAGEDTAMADPKKPECELSGDARPGWGRLADGGVFGGFDAILRELRERNTSPGGIWEYDPADLPDTEGGGLILSGQPKDDSATERGGERPIANGQSEIRCDVPDPASQRPRGNGAEEQRLASEPRIHERREGGIGNDRLQVDATQPGLGRVADGSAAWVDHCPRVGTKIPDRVNRLKCLGNAVVPQVAEAVGRCIIESEQPGGDE